MPSIVIAQGGGPTAVINQTLCGAITAARRHDPSLRILGARYGVRGLTAGDVVDLSDIPDADLLRLGHTPNSALGSTRDKPDPKACEAILAALERLEARAFVYIGGNDTAGTLELLRQHASGPCAFVHAPKTIDNDLVENDHTPGFISAAEFVAGAFLSVDLDFRALPGIYVGIVMGRHAGFLTAASAAWRLEGDSGPHLIYAPERAFSVDRFIDDVRSTMDRHRRCIVAVSEGVSTADGRSLVESIVGSDRIERDQHGNVKLSGSDLNRAFEQALSDRLPGKRARVDALGYMPRGYVGAISPVDQQEAFHAGAYAVQVATEGGGSVALQYDGTKTVLKKVPLKNVAGKTRHMPDEFMLPDANALSETGLAYFRRLVPAKYKVGKPFV